MQGTDGHSVEGVKLINPQDLWLHGTEAKGAR